MSSLYPRSPLQTLEIVSSMEFPLEGSPCNIYISIPTQQLFGKGCGNKI